VVKADGLAAGKGVVVADSATEATAAVEAALGDGAFGQAGESIVIEERLVGPEVSAFALSDGVTVAPLALAQDFKRVGDGDVGPNTGGMGAFSPVPLAGVELTELVDSVHEPVLRELAARGSSFIGLLYAGLMLTDDGPRVLEFNCRFGDPETQAILPRVEGDLLGALAAAAAGDLGSTSLATGEDAAVTVVVAAHDYPAGADIGTPIEGVAEAEAQGAWVFHAGTALRGDRLVTNGGRILAVTAGGPTLPEARARAYSAAEAIRFDGARFRGDIALEAASGATVG
jgi:phosphoribosylamine--glycine ligase